MFVCHIHQVYSTNSYDAFYNFPKRKLFQLNVKYRYFKSEQLREMTIDSLISTITRDHRKFLLVRLFIIFTIYLLTICISLVNCP